MSSFNATAQGRADILNLPGGGRLMRTGRSRYLLWLLACFLPLVILTWQINPAQATTIGNGEVVSGSVTGTGTQSWSFYDASGQSIYGGINAPTTNADFDPCVAIINPDSTTLYGHCAGGSTYGSRAGSTPTQTGTFNLKGYNGYGSFYPSFVANFQINLAVAGPVAFQTHGSGGIMYTGTTANGDLAYANNDIWKLAINAGDNIGITMTAGGGFSGDVSMNLYAPSGAAYQGAYGTSPKTLSFVNATYTGTYTLFAQNVLGPGPPATYTLTTTGSTALPTDAKTDGCCSSTTDTDPQSFPSSPAPDDPSTNASTLQVSTAQSSPLNFGGNSVIADPFNVATGNVYEQVTDYTTVGTNKLAFVRSYNSYSQQHGLYPTALGPNWRSNYDRYLRAVSASLVAAERPDGRVINFKLVSSVWTPDTDVDYKLTNSGSTYTLTAPDDTVETYTVASGKGTLNSIAYRNGYTQTLTYTSGKLTSVSDSYSRTLTLSYTGSDLTGVSTPDSATLTYGYTSTAGSDLLTSVTYNTSPSTSQTYVYANTELPFALTSITDENGNTYASWTYDGAGRATSAQHAGGADEYQISYDDSTGNRTVTNPLGETETYKFTTLQGVPKVSEIDRAASSPVASATRTFTYDTNGYLATATDWNGNSTHWTNNSHGLPTSITEAYGAGVARTTTISYDSTWVHQPYTITKTNVTIDNRYDASTGNLLTRTLTDTTGGSTNGDTEVWTYTYDGTGEMLTAKLPRTGTTVKNTYTYSSGALASITDQLSHAITISTANGTGQPTKILDANSVETDFVYDNRNRLTSKTVKAGTNEVTTYSYIGSGQPHVVTLPDSSTITYAYDYAQRLTTTTNTAGETINYTLDAKGDITAYAVKDSGGTTRQSWTATYDVLGDMLTRVGAGGAGQTTTYTYDGMMNRLSAEDANSKTTSLAWDSLNRPSTVTDANSHTAAPTYNDLDYVTAQTDFNGYSTSYTRDAFGNAIALSSPDSGSWSYTFDEDNNVTGITDARSVATTNTFDAVDRLTAVSITGYSGEAESYTYDATSGGNVGVGRLTSWTDESGSGSRVYDNFGNITSETRVIGGKTYTMSYSYDLANRLTEIIYPSGRYVDYTFDSSGYLTTVTTKPSSGGTVTTLASSITHKPFGPITGFTYGNSEALTKTYDNNYWLSTLNTVYSGTYVQELSYTQDNAGNLTAITDTLDSTRDESFGVDNLNRLHTASGKYGSRTYTYDNNSNRATEVIGGGATYTYSNTSSKNLLASYTDGTNTRHFTYTANGNMATDDRTFIGGGSVSNTFGGRDRLESQTVNSQAVTFTINAFGQRASKAFSGTTTHYIQDIGGNIIGEADGSSGTTTVEYVWMEGQLLAQIDGSGNIVYAHSDYVNNPQKITNPSRTLVWDRIQEPFGEDSSTPTNTTPTNHRFPGQYFDAENSLNYNNYRDYDRSIGRYIEADLLGLDGGPNLYAYAGQNPTQWIDPEGLCTPNNFQECAELLNRIKDKAAKLKYKLGKYNPTLDAIGGFPYFGGITIPGEHYRNIIDLQRGIRKDIKRYQDLNCDNDKGGGGDTGDIPWNVLDDVTKPIPPPKWFNPVPPLHWPSMPPPKQPPGVAPLPGFRLPVPF